MGILEGLKKKPAKKDVKAAVVEAGTVTSTAKKIEGGNAHRVFLRPAVSEKASILAGKSTYVFYVYPSATKVSVAKAFHDLYGVKPLSVRTTRRAGKMVRFGRYEGREKGEKKAIVVLPAGTTISVFGA